MQENSLKTNIRIKKRPLRLGRSIKAGIRIGVLILTAMCTVEIARMAWETYQSRTGAPGGEILVLPLIILLIWTGWTARKEYTDLTKGAEDKHDFRRSNGIPYGSQRRSM